MSRTRVRSTQRKSRPRRTVKAHRFVGVSLGGGKTDKTCVSVIEYYPEQRKIFLSRLFDKIKTEGETSADSQLLRLIEQSSAESVAFDVPLQLPHSIGCKKCRAHGFETCPEPEIQWMWKHYRALARKKSPPRLFTPYTERCVEQYLQTELEEPFHLAHALGANLAPLTARALYLKGRLKIPAIEVFPKLSLWRIGNALHLPKSHLRFHRHWEGGHASRQIVLNKMMDKNLAFIYDQDVKTLIDSPQAFDSFLCALTGLLSFLGHCEHRPKGFPKRESWIEFPKKIFAWP
ncbi:MAG TPA: DUF429 domain-containing protein [Bdellovibrionales bacterium]|nr:DUF429 domain-containing protein [Bdellovibrionales bacterium]